MRHILIFILLCFSFTNIAEAKIPEPNLVYLIEFDVDFKLNEMLEKKETLSLWEKNKVLDKVKNLKSFKEESKTLYNGISIFSNEKLIPVYNIYDVFQGYKNNPDRTEVCVENIDGVSFLMNVTNVKKNKSKSYIKNIGYGDAILVKESLTHYKMISVY